MRTATKAVVSAVVLVVLVVGCKPKPPSPPATTTTTTTAPTTTTTTAPPAARPVQISVSFTHGCAVYHDGSVRCWGNDRDGQLGDGTPSGTNGQQNAVKVVGLTDATQVATGSYATCALRSTGQVLCWGLGSHGLLGNGTFGSSAVPVPVTGITTARSIAVTTTTFPAACASLADGSVRCWGTNLRGGLGTDDLPSSAEVATPVTVEGVTDATQVSAGSNHVCARRSGGTAVCWGDNQTGQLGNPTVPNNTAGGSVTPHKSDLPVPVVGLTGATSIDAGNGHNCAMTTAGVRCWGSNWTGQLGISPAELTHLDPVGPSGGHTFTQVSAGAATCALEGTTAWCWGPDTTTRTGQIGNPNVPDPVETGLMKAPYTMVPLQVTKVTQPVTVVANGDGVSCAGLADRSVRCWGTTPNGSSLGAPAP